MAALTCGASPPPTDSCWAIRAALRSPRRPQPAARDFTSIIDVSNAASGLTLELRARQDALGADAAPRGARGYLRAFPDGGSRRLTGHDGASLSNAWVTTSRSAARTKFGLELQDQLIDLIAIGCHVTIACTPGLAKRVGPIGERALIDERALQTHHACHCRPQVYRDRSMKFCNSAV